MEKFLIFSIHVLVKKTNIEENISHMLVFRQVVVFEGHENLVELNKSLLVIFVRLESLQCKLADSTIVLVEVVEKFYDIIRSVEKIQVIGELPIYVDCFIRDQ